MDPSNTKGPLLADEPLEASSVVAHRFMNRERVLTGGNGYAREVGFDILAHLLARASRGAGVLWLDLGCGSARALLEGARELEARGVGERVAIVGVDLVDAFERGPRPPNLELVVASLHSFEPDDRFDLITAVHSLHYVGDKLALIARACRWLTQDGVFVGTLDVGTLRVEGRHARRVVPRLLRAQGVEVDLRRHRVRCDGARVVEVPLRYLGADDRGGPSFTGEPAVTSHYEVRPARSRVSARHSG